ncbi:hypothetical protein ASG29_08030 [Sphingomonas sp. Leaf412]|uniref:hypothetical protein n=1 Tax=Sphingomonas sp. Leaf412 TaxID=1736370 RepID=UPI0006F4A78C|nr:hypothetical protein [Sphingomonas sp. Leaf412]KQT31838.1 hypothetical protein ASG29_08030 [Sphingomonas sp. Leaf412]
MRLGRAAALVALAATPAAARFAPATDAPYRLTMTMERQLGERQSGEGGVRRFATDYAVTFTRDHDGYRAVLRALPASAADSGGTRHFARLQSALAGVPIIVRLDRHGGLIAVEDVDPLWDRLRAAIVATDDDPASRRRLLALHDAATPAVRVQTLAGDLLALCAGADADRRDAGRDTTLPATDGTLLPVRETVRRGRDVTVVVTRDDAGTLVRSRTIARADGLVRDMREDRRLTARHRGVVRTATTVRTARLVAMVSPYPPGTARKP